MAPTTPFGDSATAQPAGAANGAKRTTEISGYESAYAKSSSSGSVAIARVYEAIQGHWYSACLGVLLELNIADILEKETQPISVEDLAKKSDVSAPGVEYLYKVLRALAQWGILDEEAGKKFSANDSTRQLVRPPGQPTLGHFAHHQINQPKWDAWKVLPEAVRLGKTPFAVAHGTDMYGYDNKPENAAFHEEFMQSMTYFTKHSLDEGGQVTLKDVYDWSQVGTVMDVGGARGELLSRCMLYAGEKARGVLLDRPFVVASVDVDATFEAKGVKSARERLSLVGTEDVRTPFPDAVKAAHVDTIIMKHFLSGFTDDDARIVLKHCGEVLEPNGKVLLLQTLVPEAGDRTNNVCEDGVAPGLFAIEILAMCPGGSWRTRSEWEEIFGSQSFKLDSSKPVGPNMHLMVWSKQ
ncbi:O-methyltransferase family protein [Klebsormidium nitens]|uniref:O-methyltransferase family protein n=1 Tax=Klebsormidium nitens TaxID=105231 RepID=A0A1Y1I246_KLENI|nr:O-methyltransferase family protein [Klebsormidium nitens]|eukprot:GAQ85000.1 O-methyltransferase family protein [Klebsormidium nitens]